MRRAVRAVLASTALLLAAHASAVQVAPESITALDTARAEASRDFATSTAAVAAYKRVERLREPLLTSGDPRIAIWYADAAEDALLVGMHADGSGLDCLIGLPSAEQLKRTNALLLQALAWTQRADECARHELSEGTASPALMTRLETVERARRIPLLRAVAAVWAVRTGAIGAQDAMPVLESAATRLQALAPHLQGSARVLADIATGAAFIQLGKLQDATRVLSPVFSNTQLERGARTLAIALLAEASSTNAADQRRALAAHRARAANDLDDNSRIVLGDFDFRLATGNSSSATSSGRQPLPWQGWLDALAAAKPGRKALVRQTVIERITTHAADQKHAVVTLALALQRLRDPQLRQQATGEVAAALKDNTLTPDMRLIAELELGRADLALGNARDGAARLLRFAQEHAADPSSRNAIDVAVVAARAIGDPAFLATVLSCAIERFPDHPDYGAWRVEAAALSLSPDARLVAERDPAPRRYALALEALERARKADADNALSAQLVVAAAEAANEMRHASEALAVLDKMLDGSGQRLLVPGIPPDLRARLLEERIHALAIAQRVVDGDRWVAAERAEDPAGTADACARVLRRQIPVDLANGMMDPPPAEVRTRICRLAEATLRLAPPSSERDEIVVCAYLMGQMPDLALPVARRLAASRPDRADAVFALAEAIYATGDMNALAESMELHTRLSQSCPDGSPMWWVAELRRLQTLDRVNKHVEVIAPRVARLQAAHPELGGPSLHAQFLALAARHEASASASVTRPE